MSKYLTTFRSSGMLLIASVVLAAVADLLFYGHPLGWPAALYLVLLVVLLLLRGAGPLRTQGGVVMITATLGLAEALIEEPSAPAIAVSIACLGLLAIGRRNGWAICNAGGFWSVSAATMTAPIRPVLDAVVARNWRRRHPPRSPRLMGVARLWILPAIMGSVFVSLFALANPVISFWLSAAWDGAWDALVRWEGVSLFRVVFWLIAAMVVWSLVRMRLRSPTSRPFVSAASARYTLRASWRPGPDLVVRCLCFQLQSKFQDWRGWTWRRERLITFVQRRILVDGGIADGIVNHRARSRDAPFSRDAKPSDYLR